MYIIDPQFQFKVLRTDEIRFTNWGMFNSHNEHLWMQESPHLDLTYDVVLLVPQLFVNTF